MKAASVIALGLTFLMCGQAKADEKYDFFQVTCAPQIQYFSIRHVIIYNISDLGPYQDGVKIRPDADAKIQQRFGMYGLDDISKSPIKCVIPKYDEKDTKMEIIVKGIVQPNSEGYTSQNDNLVEVYANRKLIGTFDVGMHPIEKGITSLEIEHNGVEPSVSSICHFEGDEPNPLVGHSGVIRCETSKLP